MQEKVAVLEKNLIQLETDAPVNRDEHEKCKQEISLLQVSNYYIVKNDKFFVLY